MPSPTLYRWSDIAPEQINDAISRRYLNGDRVTLARFELKQGGVVPMHVHDNEQVTFVVSGRLRFHMDGREIDVGAGEVFQIPGGLAHEVRVLEDALVVDVFSPVREDWVRGTDSYFQRRAPQPS
jgi:quercetin dioxygenase-like cupin family protein